MKYDKNDIILIVQKIGIEKNYNNIDDWYNGISQQELLKILKTKKHYLKHFQSINHIINHINNNKMYFFKFKKVSNSYWKSKNNIIKYLKWFEKEFNIKCEDDWYKISNNDISNNYGSTLVTNYDYNIQKLCKILYPNYNWLEWKFNIVEQNFWKSKNNIIKYLKWFEKEFNMKYEDDWYNITKNYFVNNYGSTLYNNYNVIELCKILYPNYNWLEWKFKNINWTYSKNNIIIIKYLKWFEKEFNIKKEDDWYNITRKNIIDNYGYLLLGKYKTIQNLIKIKYPEYNFKNELFYKNNKTQLLLFNEIVELFPNEDIIFNDRKTLYNTNTNSYLEIDIYLPNLKLAIEYDGIQHFESVEFFGGIEYFNQIKKNDKLKEKLCIEKNIKLIRINYKQNDKIKDSLKTLLSTNES